MPLKLFVSGKWDDRERIHKDILNLKQKGYTITHDWTQVEQSKRTTQAMGEYATFDINGVSQADLHLVLMTDPMYAYRGTYTEIGCALALNKPIIILCPFLDNTDMDGPVGYCKTNVFFWHPNITHVKTWSQVLHELELKDIEKV